MRLLTKIKCSVAAVRKYHVMPYDAEWSLSLTYTGVCKVALIEQLSSKSVVHYTNPSTHTPILQCVSACTAAVAVVAAVARAARYQVLVMLSHFR
jgi:hypothetical protein